MNQKRNYYEKLSSSLKSKFGELLLMIAEEELLIEAQRQRLSRIPDFDPFSCFQRIDKSLKGHLRSEDFIIFLVENKKCDYEISELECFYMIKFFDSLFQGFLIFEDFQQVILPCDDL
jgi:hypothetical protein